MYISFTQCRRKLNPLCIDSIPRESKRTLSKTPPMSMDTTPVSSLWLNTSRNRAKRASLPSSGNADAVLPCGGGVRAWVYSSPECLREVRNIVHFLCHRNVTKLVESDGECYQVHYMHCCGAGVGTIIDKTRHPIRPWASAFDYSRWRNIAIGIRTRGKTRRSSSKLVQGISYHRFKVELPNVAVA